MLRFCACLDWLDSDGVTLMPHLQVSAHLSPGRLRRTTPPGARQGPANVLNKEAQAASADVVLGLQLELLTAGAEQNATLRL